MKIDKEKGKELQKALYDVMFNNKLTTEQIEAISVAVTLIEHCKRE